MRTAHPSASVDDLARSGRATARALASAIAIGVILVGCSIEVRGLAPEFASNSAFANRGDDRDTAAPDAEAPTDVGPSDSDLHVDGASALGDAGVDTDPLAEFGVWTAWARVLAAYAGDGCFRYEELVADEVMLGELNAAVAVFAEVDVETLASSSERLAYWYNAYNVFMLKAVVDGYQTYRGATVLLPVDGELVFRDERWVASNRVLSLNMIEHAVLRGDLERALVDADDPRAADLLALADQANGPEPFDVRLHFAVNCASVGCPNLRAEPYIGARLNEQLEEQTREFLNDPVKGAGPVGISELLTGLYPEDFEREAGSVASYVLRYNPDADAGLRIPYDWSLNECD